MLKINRCQTAAVNVLLMMNASRTIEVLFFYPSLSFSLFPSAYWKAGLFCLSPAEMTEFQLTTERNGCHMLKKSGPHKPRTQSVLLDTSKKKQRKKRKLILLSVSEFLPSIPIKVYGLLDLFFYVFQMVQLILSD